MSCTRARVASDGTPPPQYYYDDYDDNGRFHNDYYYALYLIPHEWLAAV